MKTRLLLVGFTCLFLLCLFLLTLCRYCGEPAIDLSFSDKASYLEVRNKLLETDQVVRLGNNILLTDREKRVERKFKSLREEFIRKSRKDHFFPPARYFYKSQKTIEQNKLFKYFKKMPKGALLHTHSAALGNFNWMVEQTTLLPNCYVYWKDDNANYVKGQIKFFKPEEVPNGFTLGRELVQLYPNFKTELLDLLTLNIQVNEDYYPIWIEFEKIFKRITGFVTYQPIFKSFYINAFNSLIGDGVQHVEIRELLCFGLYDLEHSQGYFTADTMVQYYRDMEKEMQKTYPQFTIKLIYTSLRFLPNDIIKKHLEEAFKIRRTNPDFVKGFDLVAEEDAGHSTIYFLPNWLFLDSLSQKYDIDMPLYLHGGESDWLFENNLYDLILLNIRRIGHGFNLFRYPILQKLVKEKDICLEISPLSNQILGYVRDLRIHPATYYLTQNIPITISSDDPGVFGYVGVTPDYWTIWMAWNLDLSTLKKLIINSLNYSTLSKQEKDKAFQYWEKSWDEFIDSVLK